jgi:hypothetical protein
VITGFNTDIEFQGKTYHVQTEDKGLDKPLILSLVYAGGEILASKRSPYDDLIAGGFDENTLNDRLKRQHKLICAAIQQGRIEDLKRMTRREPADEKNGSKAKKSKTVEEQLPEEIASETVLAEAETDLVIEPILEIPVAVLDEAPEVKTEKAFETNQLPLPARVLRVESSVPVADFVRTENYQIKALNLRLLEEREFHAGDRVELRVQALRGDAQPLAGAEVMVKILGSAFRPIIFHSQTSNDGIAVVNLQLPHFRAGRAALLIKAEADGYTAELRRIVTQG